MLKKFITIFIFIIIMFTFTGCGSSDTLGKIVNNSIVTDVKVDKLDSYFYGSKNSESCLMISTEQGDFAIIDDDYAQQLKDLYNLKTNNNKSLVIDIVYNNNLKIDKKLFLVKSIVIVEQD